MPVYTLVLILFVSGGAIVNRAATLPASSNTTLADCEGAGAMSIATYQDKTIKLTDDDTGHVVLDAQFKCVPFTQRVHT